MTIKKVFRKYPETVLAVLAIFFLGIIGVSIAWGIGDVAADVNNALNATIAVNPSTGFNLLGARALNLRGLVKTPQ